MTSIGPASKYGEPRPGEEGSEEDDQGAHYVTVRPGGGALPLEEDEELFSGEEDGEYFSRTGDVAAEEQTPPPLKRRAPAPQRELRRRISTYNPRELEGHEFPDHLADTRYYGPPPSRSRTRAERNMDAMRDREHRAPDRDYPYDEQYQRELDRRAFLERVARDPHNPYSMYAKDGRVYGGSPAPPVRPDMRGMRVERRDGGWVSTARNVILALAVIAIAVWAYRSGTLPEGPELRYQFAVREPGYLLVESEKVTEEEIRRGLIRDVPISRVLLDLKAHMLINANLSCICMHHLMGFRPTTGGEALTPRRLCAVINQPGREVDFMANPRAVGQSKQGVEFRERSLACDPRVTTHAAVTRPTDIWVEWDGLVANVKRPAGRRLLQYTRRFRGEQAACVALALEELDGKASCKSAEKK